KGWAEASLLCKERVSCRPSVQPDFTDRGAGFQKLGAQIYRLSIARLKTERQAQPTCPVVALQDARAWRDVVATDIYGQRLGPIGKGGMIGEIHGADNPDLIKPLADAGIGHARQIGQALGLIAPVHGI